MIRMTPEQIHAEPDAMDARARMNKRIAELENALADARRDHILLMRLVQRIGADLATALGARNSYTIIGQREYDAAMHEMEGPPPDAGMLEAVQ